MSPSPAGARPRILVYVQHLLGIGHLMRISRIASALSERFEVVVASGGMPVSGLGLGEARLVQLKPVKAGEDGFGQLVHEDGSPFDDRDQTARRDHLLALFAEFAPDALLVEAFPFGRRQMRFELLPLLELARSQSRHVLIASSIRDILQEQKKPGRAEETAALVERYFDLVLVHGSANTVRLEETYPLATHFADKVVYTGMVGSNVADDHTGETHDIIVSVGGGAVGEALIHAALEASRHEAFRGLRWLVATGPNMPAAAFDKARSNAGSGVTLERFVPNLAQRLRRARVSVSQAGYNTVADILGAGCAAVLVPFAAAGETEQTRRAQMLAERGLAVMVAEDALDPASLAAAINAALEQKRGHPAGADVRLDGAQETTRVLLSALQSA